jgi:multicomponent Na+:H+ antiporter subunit E
MTALTQSDRPLQTPAIAWRFSARLALMALLWLGLNGADGSSLIVGGPVVVAAAWLSVNLLPSLSWHWSARGALAFAGWFLRESLRGGWDVACRALAPKLALSPNILCVPFQLPRGPARLFFCGAISLLPGTAVVAITENSLCVHALDGSPRVEKELRELERCVAALFGLVLARQKEVAS